MAMERKQRKPHSEAVVGWGKENQVALSVLPGMCDSGQVTTQTLGYFP